VKIFEVPGVGDALIFPNDHPPPHVHFVHRGEGWTVKVRFSFLSDVVGLYREIRMVGHRPTERTVNEVLDYVEARLPVCRAKWWAFRASTGLEGRWAEVSPKGLVRLPLGKPTQGRRVETTDYLVATQVVRLVLEDGAELRVAAGKGIEQAEEWS
jgi:hypothetical protein